MRKTSRFCIILFILFMLAFAHNTFALSKDIDLQLSSPQNGTVYAEIIISRKHLSGAQFVLNYDSDILKLSENTPVFSENITDNAELSMINTDNEGEIAFAFIDNEVFGIDGICASVEFKALSLKSAKSYISLSGISLIDEQDKHTCEDQSIFFSISKSSKLELTEQSQFNIENKAHNNLIYLYVLIALSGMIIIILTLIKQRKGL